MKVFIALAVLCFVQAIAGQVTKEDHKLEQQNQGNLINKPEQNAPVHVSVQQTHKPQSSNQPGNNEQNVAAQNQHVSEQGKPTDNIKVPGKKPPKIQHVVIQVSQHVPEVVGQHAASPKRIVRSVQNRMTWQDMQVNAVEQPGKCQFICNQEDLKVCGYNGQCYWEFGSQCDLSTYNCFNTDKVFHVVDFAKCQDISAAKCYRGDM